MKTANPVLETIIESQSQFINNWMESAKKLQTAFASGNIASEGQHLYKEYFDRQMNILNDMQRSSANMFGQTEGNPQDFFKNWFNQQASYAKQMADFTQSIQSSFNNFGKPAHDYMSAFGQSNTAFTNIYNSWLTALNQSYDTMNRHMNNGLNKEVFGNFMQGNQVYARMQQFFQPMAEAMQKGQFNMDAFKQYFTPESYKSLTKQMFGNFYDDASLKGAYDNAIRQVQEFFAGQNNLSREYFAQWKNMTENMPNLLAGGNSGNLREFYAQIQNIFGKTFEPLLKLVSPGKEKEHIENVINFMDRLAEYSVKQAELQALLQHTAQKGIEQIASRYADKFGDMKSAKEVPTAQEMFSEWVKVNEQLYSDLFASDDFSKVKAETLNLSLDIRKHFEKQFESAFKNYPVVFKSEVEELHKTIHDLKKQLRDLKGQVAMTDLESSEEEKSSKKSKK